MKDFAKIVVYAGIFTVPFIALFVANTMFFPFITGKNFAFRIIVEIIFAAWVILALYDAQYRPKFSWIVASFLGLLVVMFFANALGEYPLQSFWSNFERMEGYVTLVHTFLFMLVTGSVMKTQLLWTRYFYTIVAATIMLAFYAFAQLSGNIVINQGGWRLDGTLGNSAYMAIYMLFLVFITTYLFYRSQKIGMRWVLGLLVLLFIYLLVQTATRGTILGLVGGSFIAVSYIALFGKEYPRVRKGAAYGLVALVATVALFITFKESSFVQGNPYLQRIASISLKEAQNRFNIWGMAFQGVQERPLLGWGQGNYTYVFNTYYKPELHGQEAWFDRVHNIVMDWLIAGGIIGTIAYFSILGSTVYYLFVRPLLRNDETFTLVERGILLGLLAGYTVHNVFVFDNIVSYIFYGTILGFIHSRVAVRVPQIEEARVEPQLIEGMIAPAIGIAMVVIVYVANVPGILATKDIIKAFRTTNPEEMLGHFEKALQRDSFGSQEVREQLTQRAQSVLQDQKVPQSLKDKTFNLVEKELLKQASEKPGDARVHVFIASFYRMTGNIDKAIEQLEIARKLSPRKQLIIFEQGIAHLQKNDTVKAQVFFKEAYELGTQFVDSKVYYASAAAFNKDFALVDELITTDIEKDAFARDTLASQAVYQAKDYPRLIDMFKRNVTREPQNTQYRTSLSFIQHESGDSAGAIATLEQAIKDIPSFEEQARQYITEIAKSSIPKDLGAPAKNTSKPTQNVSRPQ